MIVRFCSACVLAVVLTGPGSSVTKGPAQKAPGYSRVQSYPLIVATRRFRITLDPTRKLTLRVEDGRRIWEGIPRAWKPWKLHVADIDGDSFPEILVALHKSTRHFRKPHNCLFVYGFDGRTVTPRWFGSRLAFRFTDFAVAALHSPPALLALETKLNGRKCVGSYLWNGFGFTRVGEIGSWRNAKIMGVEGSEVLISANGAAMRRYRIPAADETPRSPVGN